MPKGALFIYLFPEIPLAACRKQGQCLNQGPPAKDTCIWLLDDVQLH